MIRILVQFWCDDDHTVHTISPLSNFVHKSTFILMSARTHTPIHSIYQSGFCVVYRQLIGSLYLWFWICVCVWLHTSYIVQIVLLYISQHITDILSRSSPYNWSEITIGVSIRLFLFQLNNFIKYVSMPQPMVEFVGWIYMLWFVSLLV